MLSRFLDQKKPDKGGNTTAAPTQHSTATQGSLLDLMGPADNGHHHPTAQSGGVQPNVPTGSGSLLTDFGNVEARHRHHLQQQRAALLAEQSALEDQQLSLNCAAAEPPRNRSRSNSADLGKAKQLDLLAAEIDQLQSTLRGEGASVQSQITVERERPQNPPGRAINNTFGFDSFVGALASSWKLILLCAAIGAIISAIFSLSLPNKYQSIAEVLIEPRGLKVLNNSVAPNGLNSEATVAYAESQVRIITSSSVIDPVIDDLELYEDPEFNGSSGTDTLTGLVDMIMSGGARNSNKRANAKNYLYDNLFVHRVSQTFTIEIAVSTTDPEKSARIANALAGSYLADDSGARSTVARTASEDLTARLDELRQQVRINEEKVEKYKAENGLVDANGQLVSDVQLARLNEQLVIAKVQAGDARTRANMAAESDLGDIISGSLPSTLTNATLSQLRLDYSRANARLEKLSAKLGQRHPERIAAASERRSVLDGISQEMKRIVNTAQENYKRAKARQDDLTAQVTQLKAGAVHDSAAKVKLRELNRQVQAGRQIYESFLLRSRETGAQENIRSTSARVISQAIPVNEKSGPQRKIQVFLGIMIGAALGMALALIPWLMVGFKFLIEGGANAYVAPSANSAQMSGDLYSSEPSPIGNGWGQLPLPGLGRKSAPQMPTSQEMVPSADGSAQLHAPHGQSAPPMYYENWRS
ncbi:MAG: hypothetical protein GKR97_13695 [Rhizobiaceae bacterium]|nr:hypothetical protein [Rhizobiaceae bacterium]